MSAAVTGATPMYLRSTNTCAPGTSLVMCNVAVAGATGTGSGAGAGASGGRGALGGAVRGDDAAGRLRAAAAGELSRTGSGNGVAATGAAAGVELVRSTVHTAIPTTPITANVPHMIHA
jgi:hypothetical protein